MIPHSNGQKPNIFVSLLPYCPKTQTTKPQNWNPPPDFSIFLAEDTLFLENCVGHWSQIQLFHSLSAHFRGTCLANVSDVGLISVLLTIHTPEIVLTGSYLELKKKKSLFVPMHSILKDTFLNMDYYPFSRSFCIEKPHR